MLTLLKIILPAITTLERLVREARAMAEKKLFSTVSLSLTNERKEKLEEIITSQHPSESNKTILGWLKEPPGHPSPETFLKVIERLEYIREIELETVKISHLHRNRLLQLYRLGSRYEPYAFRDFQENKQSVSFNEDLLHPMSPLGWEHINLLGEYHFNSEKIVWLDSLRPLKPS